MPRATISPDSPRQPAHPARAAARPGGSDSAATASDSPIVYLVDDDGAVRRAMAELLRSVGLDCEMFASAAEFLAYERPDRPCCLVCDVRLPAQSGLDLQQRLNQGRDELPIVFVTGYGTVELGVRAMRAGAVHFLEKPFEDQDLLDAVFQAIERGQRRRLEEGERARLRQRYETLTPREREVLELVVSGLANKRIAAHLDASEKTIKVHRGRVMSKMQADSLAQLVSMAARILPLTPS